MTDMVQTISKLALAQEQLVRQAEQWIEKTGAIGVAGYELKTREVFLKGSGYLNSEGALK